MSGNRSALPPGYYYGNYNPSGYGAGQHSGGYPQGYGGGYGYGGSGGQMPYKDVYQGHPQYAPPVQNSGVGYIGNGAWYPGVGNSYFGNQGGGWWQK